MLQKSDFVKIGEIRKTHGVKGEMMLIHPTPILLSDETEWLFFNIEECLIPFKLEDSRFTNEATLLFSVEEIDVIEDAAAFVGVEVFVPESEHQKDGDVETPISLVGYTVVVEKDKKELGKVVDFIESALNPLLEIEYQDDTILLPFNEAFILGIEDDYLYVELPEGLLDL